MCFEFEREDVNQMKQRRQLALAVSLALLGGASLTGQSLAAEVATPSKANEIQAGNYVFVTNSIEVGTATNSTVGSVKDGTETYSVKVGYSEEEPATNDTLATTAPSQDEKITGAMATGYGSTATGLLANANGVKAQAYGDASLAFGTQAQSYGSSSIAIGTDAQAGSTSGAEANSGNAAIAIGLGSRANENLSLAIGGNAQSNSISSMALGAFARTYGVSTMAVGAAAEAHDIGDIAIGTGSYVDSAQGIRTTTASLAIGYLAKTTGGQSVAIGGQSLATGDIAVAIGTNTRASNLGAIAIGGASVSTNAWGTNSVGLGSGASARGDYSTAIGSTALGIGYQSVAAGFSAKAVGNGVAIGSNALVGSTRSSNTTAIGGIALGSDSLAITSYGVKGYDPFANAQVQNMSDVLSGESLTDYTDNKAATDSARSALEAAEKAYKSDYSTFTSKVKAIEANTTMSDAEKKTELTKLYDERAALAKKYNDAYTDLYVNEDNDTEGIYYYNVAAGTWEATGSALSIGNTERGLTRQITGVAAGNQDTDAVNVAQLKRSRVTLEAGNNITLADATEDKSTGMVYKVNGLRTDVTADSSLKLTSNTVDSTGVTTYNLGLSDTLTDAINNAATTSLSNLTDDGKTAVRNLAKESVKVVDGTNTTVTPGTDGTYTTYAVNVSDDAIKAAVKADLDLKANASDLASKADASALETKANADGSNLVLGDTAIANLTKQLGKTAVAVDGDKLTMTSTTNDATGVTTYTIGLNGDLTSKIEGAADNNLSNLGTEGQKVVTDLARGAVAVAQADNYVTVDADTMTDPNKTTYKVGLNVENLKAGLAAGENGLATKADVTNLNNGIQDQIKKLNESQLTEDQVKDFSKGSVAMADGTNTTVETEDVNGVKTFTVNVSNDAINAAVKPEMDKVNGRVDATNTRVDSIDTKVQTVDNRVTTVEGNVTTLRTDVNNISSNVSLLNTNVDNLTTNVNTLTTDLGNLTNDVNTLSENMGAIAGDVSSINNRVGKLDRRLDKVGASAAALAALNPLGFDEEDKFSIAAGIGNYKGEQAMALGAFYQANEDTMFSVGGTLGDENMLNLGVSYRFGSKGEGQRPSGPKAVRALTSEVESLQAKNATLENTVATQQERLARQEAELAAQRQLIEQLAAKVGL